jgi:hypothetical protein
MLPCPSSQNTALAAREVPAVQSMKLSIKAPKHYILHGKLAMNS